MGQSVSIELVQLQLDTLQEYTEYTSSGSRIWFRDVQGTKTVTTWDVLVFTFFNLVLMHWALPDLCAIRQTTKGWAPAICRGDLFIESLFPEQAAREVNFTLAPHIWWHIMPWQFVHPLCWKQNKGKRMCVSTVKRQVRELAKQTGRAVGCLECLDASMLQRQQIVWTN